MGRRRRRASCPCRSRGRASGRPLSPNALPLGRLHHRPDAEGRERLEVERLRRLVVADVETDVVEHALDASRTVTRGADERVDRRRLAVVEHDRALDLLGPLDDEALQRGGDVLRP